MDGAVATGRDRGALNPRSKFVSRRNYPSPRYATPRGCAGQRGPLSIAYWIERRANLWGS